MVKSIQAKNLNKTAKNIMALNNSKDNIYTELATLRLAKTQINVNKNAKTIKTLRDVPTKGELKQIVQQRLTRVLTKSGKPDETIKLLADTQDHASLKIRADALMIQSKPDEAHALYAKALTTVNIASPQHQLLETKLMDVNDKMPNPTKQI